MVISVTLQSYKILKEIDIGKYHMNENMCDISYSHIQYLNIYICDIADYYIIYLNKHEYHNGKNWNTEENSL